MKTFESYVEEVKEKYNGIININKSDLDKIQLQFEKNNLHLNTNKYIFAVSMAVLLLFTSPIIISFVNTTVAKLISEIEINNLSIANQRRNYVFYSIALGTFSIVIYFFLLPFHYSILKNGTNKDDELLRNIDVKQRNFILAAIISVYTSIVLVCSLYYQKLDFMNIKLSVFYEYALSIPLSFLALYLYFFGILKFMGRPFIRIIKTQFKNKSNYTIEICHIILKVLLKLSEIDKLNFVERTTVLHIRNDLKMVIQLVKEFPYQYYHSDSINDLTVEFEKASIYFKKQIDEATLIKSMELEEFKKLLVFYLNIFLDGDLAKLPKHDIIPISANHKKSKLIHYFLFAIYLIFPIVSILILKIFFNYSLDEYSQSLIRILYIIWAFVGVFSNPFILNDESKDLLKDMIKTITGKS